MVRGMVSRGWTRAARRVVGIGVVGLAVGVAAAARLSAAPHEPEALGARVTALRLKDTTGKVRSLGEFSYKEALVLVFLGTDCPISNSYAPLLSQLDTRYRLRGVQFLGVNADPAETRATVASHAKAYRFSFPVLRDPRQEVAEEVDARVTPEVFVLDHDRVVRYRGRIDDRYASRTQVRSQATTHDLEAALEAVLAGKPVADPVTRAYGCAIMRGEHAAGAGPVTYYKDVAPIVQGRCQGCHRPGQVAPFSLLTYADAKKWAMEIKTFTQSRQMPPWKAEPGHGDFTDVRRLSDPDVTTLAAWADAGAPAGNPKDAPAPVKWTDDWMLGQPDLVLKMPEPFHVEASGDDIFQVFVLPSGLTETRQVVAMEVKPGNAHVLHHIVAFADATGAARALDARDPAPGYNSGPGGVGFQPSVFLGGWAPGNFPHRLPSGVGRPLPKGADLVIQAHYHKTGKPEDDQTSVGLYFAKEPVRQTVRTLFFGAFNIDIPAGAPRYEAKTSFTAPEDWHMVSVLPHMHLLGQEMKMTATLPDGTVKDLVWVKDWDYRWQDTYYFKQPVALPKGTRIDLSAFYDNSPNNPRNPSKPPRRVTFGEQTTDEMGFAIFDFTVDAQRSAQR
jgi:peroxiredoxin